MANRQLYKFLHKRGRGIYSEHGNHKWKIGEWYSVSGDVHTCYRGFHGSRTIADALGYVQGNVLAICEVRGSSSLDDDKEAWESMKIVRAYKWTKADSVALAIYAAEEVLKIYEKLYPNDDRPRNAIEAARKTLVHDTAKNRKAAYAAADAAADAAYAAALQAKEQFGAISGQGEGLQGQSYAIPTMEGFEALKAAVKRFLDFASSNSELKFLLTPIGTGIAGYSHEQIAPLFSEIPENVCLPEEWI